MYQVAKQIDRSLLIPQDPCPSEKVYAMALSAAFLRLFSNTELRMNVPSIAEAFPRSELAEFALAANGCLQAQDAISALKFRGFAEDPRLTQQLAECRQLLGEKGEILRLALEKNIIQRPVKYKKPWGEVNGVDIQKFSVAADAIEQAVRNFAFDNDEAADAKKKCFTERGTLTDKPAKLLDRAVDCVKNGRIPAALSSFTG